MGELNFIHSADLHLVSPRTPEGAHRLEVLRELCALARQTQALVLSGDVFDSAQEAAELEQPLREVFASLRPARALIIPGNHDTLRGPDPFDGRFDFGQGDALTLLDRAPFQLAVLSKTECYGFPFARSRTSFDLTREVPPKKSAGTRIAILHGLAADRPQLCAFALDAQSREEGGESVLRDDDLRNAGFNYCALGHIHRQELWRHGENCLLGYAGSPDPVRVTETGPRRALAVSLDESTGAAKAAPVELKKAGRAHAREFFVFPGEERGLEGKLEQFLSSCGEDARAAVTISGLADGEALARLRAQALDRWRPRLKLGLEIRLRAEPAPAEGGDMALYGFMRALRERAEGGEFSPETERRVLALGWRALSGRGLEPEDLLEEQ